MTRHGVIVIALALAGGSSIETAAVATAGESFAMPVPTTQVPAPIPAGGISRDGGPEFPSLPAPAAPPTNPREAAPEIRHGLLEIPSIGLSQPFFEGVSLTAIDRGPSHWPGTAMPGELGNVVIAGHRTTRTRPFWDLDLVQPGAELIFTMTNGNRYVYTLDYMEVVDGSAIGIVDQRYAYTATLFGCHPKGSARQRIVGHFTLRSSSP